MGDFWRCIGQLDGLQSYCKLCSITKKKQYILSHPDFNSKHNKIKYQRHKQKIKLKNKIWKDEHKELIKQQSKTYYLKNKERILKYNLENRDHNREVRKAREKLNRPLTTQYQSWRSNLIRQATPKWADKKKIKEIYEMRKRITQDTGILHHVDHIIPIIHPKVCGLHVHENLKILEAKENARKRNEFICD